MARRKGKYSRAQARAKIRRTKRRSGSTGWTVATVVVVIVGVVGIVLARGGSDSNAAPVVNKDHWHAYLGVNVCGTWLPAAPAFESPLGIHSHGDGLMHIHPYSSAAAGKNATVGRFIDDNEGAGWELDSTSMKLWDAAEYQDGYTCPSGEFEGKKANLVWATGQFGDPWNGTPRKGNPADFRPQNADIVAIAFLPKGQKVPEPPDAESALSSIQDLGGAPAASTSSTVAGSSVTDPTAPAASESSTTVPTTPAPSTP
ncbi:MAG: hypothetical protein ACXW1M_02110 [Acidimicrobiia bacterium]